MVAGHYATALFARQKVPQAPLVLLLVCAISLDIIWLTLCQFGLESLKPDSWLVASINHLQVSMPYSHDLLPVIGWTIFFSIAGLVITREIFVALWCGILVFVHWLCDLLVGFTHYLWDAMPPKFGLNLYVTHPYLAILIETLFCFLVVTWFVRKRATTGRPLATKYIVMLYLLYVGGALSLLPLAEHNLSYWWGL